MSIASGLEWLNSLPSFEDDRSMALPGLESIKRLAYIIGDPQHSYRSIHITGTNGKGTVAAIASKIFEVANVSAGTYTSPDLGDLTERIKINNQKVPTETLDRELCNLRDLCESFEVSSLTKFEALTLAALSIFSLEGLEVAVVEVGMGGRSDATNILDSEVAVVTSVDLDHMRELGNSKFEIAQQKSGIIKAGSSLVLGDVDEELVGVFQASGPRKLLRYSMEIRTSNVRQGVGGWMFDLTTPRGSYSDLFLSLRGGHQVPNAALAIGAIEELKGGQIAREILENALANMDLPGHFEVVGLGGQKVAVLDVAHNPAAVSAFSNALKEEFPNFEGWVVFLALSHERDSKEFLSALGPSNIDSLIAVDLHVSSHVDPLEIAYQASSLGVKSRLLSDVDGEFDNYLASVREDQLVVVVGGHAIVGKIRTLLGR